jgi:hypothetical protein
MVKRKIFQMNSRTDSARCLRAELDTGYSDIASNFRSVWRQSDLLALPPSHSPRLGRAPPRSHRRIGLWAQWLGREFGRLRCLIAMINKISV